MNKTKHAMQKLVNYDEYSLLLNCICSFISSKYRPPGGLTEEVIDVCIRVHNQTDRYYQFIKRYLFSAAISASYLLL